MFDLSLGGFPTLLKPIVMYLYTYYVVLLFYGNSLERGEIMMEGKLTISQYLLRFKQVWCWSEDSLSLYTPWHVRYWLVI